MLLRLFPVALAALVFALDQWTKWMVRTHEPATVVIPGYLNIVHVENPGVAFGLLSQSPSQWRGLVLIGVSVLILGYIAILVWRSRTGAAIGLRLALALIMAGALGNLYDRVTHHTVTDFIEVHSGPHYFPVFNVADSSISVGGAVLVLLELLSGRKKKAEEDTNVSPALHDR